MTHEPSEARHRDRHPGVPVVLLGHSMGGRVAWHDSRAGDWSSLVSRFVEGELGVREPDSLIEDEVAELTRRGWPCLLSSSTRTTSTC